MRLENSPAARVDEALAKDFHSRFVHRVVLVVRGIPGPDHPEGRAALQEIVEAIRAVPGVSGTVSYLDSRDELVSRARRHLRGRRTRRPCGVSGNADDDRCARPRSRRRAEPGGAIPGRSLLWTGEIPLNLDVVRASSEDARAAERRALPIALLLLLAAFGSVVAALLPAALGILSVLLTLGVAAVVARSFHLSIFVQNVASMIGLGLGIDYALLMVSRFRESLARKHSPGSPWKTAFRGPARRCCSRLCRWASGSRH